MYNPSSGTTSRRSRSRRTELERIDARLESVARRQVQLQNAMSGLAREVGISVSGPCNRCERSLLLIRNGMMYCPECGDRRSL